MGLEETLGRPTWKQLISGSDQGFELCAITPNRIGMMLLRQATESSHDRRLIGVIRNPQDGPRSRSADRDGLGFALLQAKAPVLTPQGCVLGLQAANLIDQGLQLLSQ